MRTRPLSASPKKQKGLSKLRQVAIDYLEPRRLLTTFTGGQSFDYEDFRGNVIEVNFFGNITAEVIGIDGNSGNLINLPELHPGQTLPTPTPNHSLFAIYVSQSDLTGGITIAQVPTTNITPIPTTTLPSEPFTGSIGSITVLDSTTGMPETIGAPANSGAALLGGVTDPTAAMDPAQPILSASTNGHTFGVLPASVTTLNAGLTVAPGQNLGFFYIGGTVMGQVHIGGAINTFYAGWLITGNSGGEAGAGSITYPQNFTVAGDIQNLLVGTSIGTDNTGTIDPTALGYLSGFDMFVNGTIGTVHAYGGDILGSINAANQTGAATDGADQQEIEVINDTPAGFDFFANGELGGNSFLQDDTFSTAQYVSNNYNATNGTDDSVVLDGTLQDDLINNDHVDYYAVPLLAGQTITVQVADPNKLLDVGIYSPDNVLVASDYNEAGLAADNFANPVQETPIQFTPTEPGIYRFAVAEPGDTTFNGSETPDANDIAYTLTITNVGHMGIGEIVASGDIFDNPNTNTQSSGFATQNGDIGAVVAGGNLVSVDSPPNGETIDVENGSLRSVIASSITGTNLLVPNGNVGLVQTTTGSMGLNDFITEQTVQSGAIGGDYELISSAGDFNGSLAADGNIGTIDAASISGGIFAVNAARKTTFAGHIDLIDDAGDFGTSTAGGPSIYLGPDGVLTYLHVGGTTYGNAFFGDAIASTTLTYAPNEIDSITEATGAVVTLTPVATTAETTPTLTVTTYPINDGGSAIVNVTTTGGLTINSSGNVSGQQFGIADVDIQGSGNAVNEGAYENVQNFDGHPTIPITAPPTLAGTSAPVDFNVTGNTQIGVFNLTGSAFDQISNSTPGGEIVNVSAGSIGTLSGNGPIGVGLNHSTAAQIFPTTAVLNTFPFADVHTGVVVTGSVVSIDLPIVGNISVGGSIGTVTGSIEAPLFASGSINNVILGSGGVYPSGSGNLSDAGIYADGAIGNVVGNNADIRGTVASTTGIQSIHLQNGSIIDARIGSITDLSQTENISQTSYMTPTAPSPTGSPNSPTLDVGSIVTNGDGGIIGSFISGSSIGIISARNGFGILGTIVSFPQGGTFASMYADGYGIRSDTVAGGYNVGSVTANGNGSLVSTATFSSDVRVSEDATIDPLFNFEPNPSTDLDKFLSTESTTPVNATTPVVPGVTDTGVISDSSFASSHNLGSVTAWSIRGTSASTYGISIFNFANSVGSFTITGPVDGLQIVTGKLGSFIASGDLEETNLDIAGHIKNLTIRANITDNSEIIAHGRNGTIGTLNVVGNVAGLIEADGGKINNITIHGSLTGKIQTKNINNLTLYQNLGSGSLVITGNANTINLLQDLGPQGNTLTVDGRVGTLKVGSNLTGNFTCLGNVASILVAGSIENGSKITIDNQLGLLKVGADFQAGAIVQAHKVKKVKVAGDNAGTITSI